MQPVLRCCLPWLNVPSFQGQGVFTFSSLAGKNSAGLFSATLPISCKCHFCPCKLLVRAWWSSHLLNIDACEVWPKNCKFSSQCNSESSPCHFTQWRFAISGESIRFCTIFCECAWSSVTCFCRVRLKIPIIRLSKWTGIELNLRKLGFGENSK